MSGMFIHISFILSASGNHWLPLVARWSHQVPQLQPPPGCQHYQRGRLPASPSQVMMVQAAVGRGDLSEKSWILLETCWRLLSFLIKLEVQWGSRFSKTKTSRKTGKLQANITGITPSHIIRVQVRDPQNISKLQPNLSCLPLTPARSGSGLQGNWVTTSKCVP